MTAALWGDYDNDGFTDVYLCRDGANQLWRQTAKGHWADVTAAAHADGGGGATIDGALFDADHDGDLDLLLIKRDGGDELLNNNGDGTFRSHRRQNRPHRPAPLHRPSSSPISTPTATPTSS